METTGYQRLHRAGRFSAPKRFRVHPTTRQLEYLLAIDIFVRTNRYSPALRELGHMVGVSGKNAIVEMLTALEHHGWVRRVKCGARTIALTTEGRSIVARAKSVIARGAQTSEKETGT